MPSAQRRNFHHKRSASTPVVVHSQYLRNSLSELQDNKSNPTLVARRRLVKRSTGQVPQKTDPTVFPFTVVDMDKDRDYARRLASNGEQSSSSSMHQLCLVTKLLATLDGN